MKGERLHREKAMWRQSKKAAVCKPGRGLSPAPNHADMLLSGSSLQNRAKGNIHCLSYPAYDTLPWQTEQTGNSLALDSHWEVYPLSISKLNK